MESIDLLIQGGFVITQNAEGDEFSDGSVAIKDGTIVAVGETQSIRERYQAQKVIDAGGKVVLPGFINSHTHLFQTFMKGLGSGLEHHAWLKQIPTQGLLHMSLDDIRLSALIGCLDAISSGTTTILEYMYPNPKHEVADVVFAALEEAGIRGLLGRGIADIKDSSKYPYTAYVEELVEPLSSALEDCERLAEKCNQSNDGLIKFCLAPPAIRFVTEEALGKMTDFAQQHQCVITMHMCETQQDNRAVQEREQLPAITWLRSAGFLNPNVLAVHCVNVNEQEIEWFSEHDVKVSYNPVSNMYLGNGVAPIPKMLMSGIVTAIATDGATSNNTQDIIEAMKAGVLLQRANARDASVLNSRDVIKMATINGARAVGLSDSIGSLEKEKRADIVILDFLNAKAAPFYDAQNTLVFSCDTRSVSTVLVNGVPRLEDGQFVGIDEERIARLAQSAGHQWASRAYGEDIFTDISLGVMGAASESNHSN